jgi:hypothetical protein
MAKEIVGIKIGMEKEAIEEVGKVIISILQTTADQDTLKTALNVLPEICKVSNVSISDCNIGINKEEDEDEYVTTTTTY